MQEKIIEIIEYLLSQINDSKTINEIDIEPLSKRGYTNAEIHTAFAWLNLKFTENESIFNADKSKSLSKRFFHTAEKNILTPSAMGYIIQMMELGVIDEYDVESIIEKIFISGYVKADVQDIKYYISSIILGLKDDEDILSRMINQNNETIH